LIITHHVTGMACACVQLSYIMRDSESVPVHLVSTCGSRVIRLDLSENRLRL